MPLDIDYDSCIIHSAQKPPSEQSILYRYNNANTVK